MTVLPRLSLFAATVLWFAGRAPAQVYLGLDATLASPYVWRGLTRANDWVLQPEGFAAVKTGGTFFSVGTWASYELRAAGPTDLTDLGIGQSGLAEVDYWAQAARAMGVFHAGVGAIRYTFRGTAPGAGRTRANNTTELYASLRATSKYIVPGLAAWVDVDHVRGTYLEGSAEVPVLANPLAQPFIALITRATLGYTLGQELNASDPTQGGYFVRDGVTHLDLSASGDLTVHPLGLPAVIRVEGHVQFNVDDATRRTSADPSEAHRSAKLWAALALRVSGPVVR